MIKDYVLERLFNIRSPSKEWLKWVGEFNMDDACTMAIVTYLGDGIGKCKCSKCGKRIDKTDNYCRFCGRKITGTKITRG